MNEDPAQGELELGPGAEGRPGPYLSDRAWQLEAMWRTILNGGVVLTAITLRWAIDAWAAFLGVEQDWVLTVLIWVFRIAVIPTVAVAVIADFVRLVARRAPNLWQHFTEILRQQLPRPKS